MSDSFTYRVTLVLAAALVAVAGCTGKRPVRADEGGGVPAAFAKLYAELDATLDRCRSLLGGEGKRAAKLPAKAAADTALSAELITANANRGPELLGPNALAGCVLLLDRFKGLGLRGVKISINYPLLTPGYPRSGEYLAFYKKVAAEARQRGMKILVGLGLIFTESEISTVKPDYAGLTREAFLKGQREYARLVIDEIGPDYLTVLNEPGTMKHIVPALAPLAEPAEYGRALAAILAGLDRKTTLVGAGAGTWDDPAFFRQAAASALDYVDIHSYPLQRGCFERALEAAGLARASGKRVVVGEAWLYKVTADELVRQGAVSTEAFGRDSFSFWAPLDSKFLGLMAALARRNGVDFLSFYWGAKHFFAYLDYDRYQGASPGALLAQSSAEAAKSIVAGRLTDTGRALGAKINCEKDLIPLP